LADPAEKPVRFRLKRDFVDVPAAQAMRLIGDLESVVFSPQMRASAVTKIREAISTIESKPRITFSLGEKVTMNETLRRAWEQTRALPPALRELLDKLNDELNRARGSRP
jgi:hypothetical protein